MHVCHLVHDLTMGGIERQIIRMIQESCHDSVSYTVAYFGSDITLKSEMEEAGADLVHINSPGEHPIHQFTPRSLRTVASLLNSLDVDILHCHTSLYLHIIGRISGRLAEVPVIGTYHNTRRNFNPGIQVLERITRPMAAVNVGVSKEVERSFTGSAKVYDPGQPRLKRKSYTIYNGINFEEFATRVSRADVEQLRSKYKIEDELVFLNVGRYSAVKNQKLVIQAMEDFISHNKNTHLFIVGGGELEEDLRRAVESRQIREYVTVTGRVPSVHDYYALADVFILPSTTEGLSLVLLEAMAASLPIIGTDVAGTGEAVINEETGLIVPSESPTALVDAMSLMSSEKFRERLGNQGYERVKQQFSICNTVNSYQSIYHHVLENHRFG